MERGVVWRGGGARSLLLALLAASALAGCRPASIPSSETADATQSTDAAQAMTGKRIADADAEPQNWLSHGRNYQETRFSPLDQIDTANAANLGLQWSYDLDTNRGQEGTPLVVDGIIYATSAWSKLHAFDGVTGKLLWQFDPKVPGTFAVKACCDVVNRGAAYWDGKLFVGTLDGRLIAVDAKTGKQLWSVVTVDQSRNYTITGAPRVVKGRVLIGNGGAEYGVRGYVSAYDANTGKLDWRFYTVPGDPAHPDGAASDEILAKLAKNTWSTDSWQRTHGGGGGTVWDSMSYDPELDLLYIGVGNGGYWAQRYRSPTPPPGGNNDNLFLASIVALRPETGEYVWHFQETPGDQWDYTSTQQMVLTDLKIGGVTRKVLMQAPKNGFFYVLDRQTGKLIDAKPFARMNWNHGIDPKTGRPLFNPDTDYSKTGKLWVGQPGPQGAHGWMSMSYSPKTGLVYIPAQENSYPYLVDPNFKPLPKGYDLSVDSAHSVLSVDPKKVAEARAAFKGSIKAWNPVTMKLAWEVPQENGSNGGILSTAGNLVFQGASSGMFSAYDAATGHRLWRFDAQSGIVAAPVTWAKDGKQYVTVLTGWGGTEGLGVGPINWSSKGPRHNISRVLTFTLGGTAKLPPLPGGAPPKLQPPPQFADAATIEEGRKLYARSCYGCHGPSAMSAGVLPDLRYSGAIADRETWNQILIDGVLSDDGMVSFKDNYSADQLNAIRAYVINQAIESKRLGSR